MRLISIVIPCYNSSSSILKCVESILKSPEDNYEIILVNDGSTDDTLTICNTLSVEYDNIVVIDKPNGGASSARNLGILNASGDYLMFLDSDDYWKNEIGLTSIKGGISTEEDVDIILFGVENFNSVSKSISQRVIFTKQDISYLHSNSFEENIDYLYENSLFPSSAWSIVIRKSLLLNNDLLFKEGIVAEDIDWMVGVMKQKPEIRAIEDSFYRYHKLREGSVTSTSGKKAVTSLLYILDKWVPVLDNKNSIDVTLVRFLAFHFGTLILAFSKLEDGEQLIYADSVKKYLFLLNYNKSKKITFIKYVISVMGLIKGSRFLNKLYKYYLKVN
jgi:glycosyltransferase involved in cell wall biosynthesis